jgi:preprotein translocase subunit SecD
MNYEFQLEHLKYQFTGSDSIKIIELEKKMTEDEIVSRLNIAFIEVFRDEEILEIYHFVKTRAFEKFFNSRETHKIIDSKFIDIDKEIEEISNHIDEIVENPTNKFETIPVDRENGFYATVDYDFSAADKDIKLEDQPSLTLKDILEVKKDFSSYNNRPEISIVFTKEGAKKFYLLTKENIGKPLAIVLEKHIVFMPLINSEIVGGKVSISGDFSEMEVDKMIEILKE